MLLEFINGKGGEGDLYKLSTSMMCANPFVLQAQIKVINLHTDFYHIDIMDGHFVPNIALSVDYVKELKSVVTKPIDVHLMVTDPDKYLDKLLSLGVNCISFHIDTVRQSVFRLINRIKQSGVKIGIAISPSSSIDEYAMFLPLMDKITIMTVEPGYAGQSMIKEVLPKITDIKHRKRINNCRYSIEVDGSNNFNTFKTYMDCGAEIFILGTGLFNYSDLNKGFIEIKAHLCEKLITKPRVVFGIDIGGTFTRMGVVSETRESLSVEKISTLTNPQFFVDSVSNMYNKYIQQFDIKAIAIGYPGIVDASSLSVVSLPNLSSLEGSDYLHRLKKLIDAPLIINKDTNFLLINDISHHNLTSSDVLGFYLGTGFGHSMIMMGQLHMGTNYSAGEIGHLPLFEDSSQCRCGQFDCTETKVSGVYLRRLHQEFFPETDFEDLFTYHGESSILREFIRDFSKVVSISITLLDIPNIVIGGGVVDMDNFPKVYFEEMLLSFLRSQKAKDSLKIFYSTNKPENGVIGAALFAFEILGGKYENCYR